MVKCEFKSEHGKNVCLKYIGLCVQNFFTILGLIIKKKFEGRGDILAPKILAFKIYSRHISA